MSQIRSIRTLALGASFMIAFGVTAAEAQNKFGAIAYNKSSGRYGYSYNYNSRGEAEDRALSECTGSCDIVVWFKNACGALATGNGGWGAAWAPSRRGAENKAVDACSEHANNCSVIRWVCTDR